MTDNVRKQRTKTFQSTHLGISEKTAEHITRNKNKKNKKQDKEDKQKQHERKQIVKQRHDVQQK